MKINGKTIDEINVMLAEASQEAAEQFEKEQAEAEQKALENEIDLVSERQAQIEWEQFVEENELGYAEVSGGW